MPIYYLVRLWMMSEMLKLMKQAVTDSNNHLNQRIDYVMMDIRDTKENIRDLQENAMGIKVGGPADYLKKCLLPE